MVSKLHDSLIHFSNADLNNTQKVDEHLNKIQTVTTTAISQLTTAKNDIPLSERTVSLAEDKAIQDIAKTLLSNKDLQMDKAHLQALEMSDNPLVKRLKTRLEIQQYLNEEFSTIPKNIPAGCNVVIMKHGEPPLMLQAGHIPANTPQHWGSVSKQFTAACIALLAKRGDLSFEDDILNHLRDLPEFKDLPDFKLNDSNGRPRKVTIDDLLNMRSGLPDVLTLLALSGKEDQMVGMEEKLAFLKKHPFLEFEPGSRFSYCNTNYYLLARIVEKVSGESFVDFARNHLFIPNGMWDTRFSADSSCKSSVHGYAEREKQFIDVTTQNKTYGATGIVGPPGDMAHWDKLLESGEMNLLAQPPKSETIEEGKSVYCRGLNVAQLGDYRVTYHRGGIEGFVTTYARYEHADPRRSFSLFVASNLEGNDRVERITDQVADKVAGVQIPPLTAFSGPPPQKPAGISLTSQEVNELNGRYHCQNLNSDGVLEMVPSEDGKTLEGRFYVVDSKTQEINKKRYIPFIPIRKEMDGSLVLEGPMGDLMHFKKDEGFILTGAKSAPIPFTKVV